MKYSIYLFLIEFCFAFEKVFRIEIQYLWIVNLVLPPNFLLDIIIKVESTRNLRQGKQPKCSDAGIFHAVNYMLNQLTRLLIGNQITTRYQNWYLTLVLFIVYICIKRQIKLPSSNPPFPIDKRTPIKIHKHVQNKMRGLERKQTILTGRLQTHLSLIKITSPICDDIYFLNISKSL